MNRVLFILLLSFSVVAVMAQGPLEREVSVHADGWRLKKVLELLEQKAGCSFSYESTLLNTDSVLSVHADRTNLRELFNNLFQKKYNLVESDNHVMITLRLPGLSILNPDITDGGQSWSFSGFVVDDRTGERIRNASVYEKRLLQSTLTDEHGYFKMRFRTRADYLIRLTLAKLNYRDTTITMLATVPVSSRVGRDRKLYEEAEKNIETTSLGSFLTSRKQRVQSLNIRNFFANSPFQVSLAPGISTHGLLSSQIVNKFSLNLAGGYTAGVNGFEIGGLFNVNKMDSRYLQLSGVFNLTGRRMTGVQISAVHNMVLDTVSGVQIGGFINHSEGPVKGVQIGGLHNYAKKLKGVQIGLVNVADSSSGASIGLVNIIRNGHYKLSLSANDAMNTNLAFQTGTSGFYSVIKAGLNINPSEKMYAFGMGIGREFFSRRKLSALTEFNYMIANTDGTWDDRWVRFETSLNLRVGKGIEVFGGPSFNYYRHSGEFAWEGYKNIVKAPYYQETEGVSQGRPVRGDDHPERSWLGWQGGVAFRSSFKQPQKAVPGLIDKSASWYLGIGLSGGLAWDYPYGLALGADVRLVRHLGGNIDGMFTIGLVHLGDQTEPLAYSLAFSTPGETYYFRMKHEPFTAIPVKGGVRALLGKTFYVGGEVGIGFCSGDWAIVDGQEIPQKIRNEILGRSRNTSFVYSPSLGLAFRNGVDAAFKFEDFVIYPSSKQFALRLAYNLRISQ